MTKYVSCKKCRLQMRCELFNYIGKKEDVHLFSCPVCNSVVLETEAKKDPLLNQQVLDLQLKIAEFEAKMLFKEAFQFRQALVKILSEA